MALTHVIVPWEFDARIDAVLDELNIGHDCAHVSAEDMLTESPDRPNYAQALDELDMWHDVNMWSNEPILIYTSGVSTQGLVDELKANKAVYNKLIVPLAQEESAESGVPIDDIMRTFEEGPTELFMDLMIAMREENRLDRKTIE